jgi:hypothetical protein
MQKLLMQLLRRLLPPKRQLRPLRLQQQGRTRRLVVVQLRLRSMQRLRS